MKPLTLVVGPVLSIAGAVGLIVSGGAIVAVLDGVLTYRFGDPPQPLPASLGQLGWAAVSGTALACGLLISCVAIVIRDSQKTLSLAGKILQVLAGSLLFVGTMPVLWGLLAVKQGFFIISTSAEAPKPENVREMVGAAAPMLTVGFGILLVGATAMLVAGQVGVRVKPSQTIGTRSTLGVLAAIGSLLLGLAVSLFFLGVWGHGTALEAMIADPTLIAKPSELAQHLVGILNKSLVAFIGMGCQGILQAAAAIFAPATR